MNTTGTTPTPSDLVNDKSKWPLWLPRGSVRALIALSIIGAYICGAVDAEIALLVLGFYFGARTANGK